MWMHIISTIFHPLSMSQQIFINLTVKDLDKSKTFFETIGYTINPDFSNQDGACVIIDDGHIFVMLLTEAHFQKFTHKKLVDSTVANEALMAISLESREAVDSMYARVLSAGGVLHREEDLGFMYTKSIADLDGHIWEFFYMDTSKMPKE
jgi:uncharacterized protein